VNIGSSLRQSLEDYLTLRRALGFKLHNVARLLGQFVDYLNEHDVQAPTTQIAVTWAMLPAGASPNWRAIRLSAVRGFTAYLHAIDPCVEVPPAGLIRSGPCRATPYLYTQAEITALVTAAGGLRPRLRAATYQMLIGLLAVSGIRIGEAIAADTLDLDIARGHLVVRHAKLDTSRLVPLHPSSVAALTGYLDLRAQLQPTLNIPALLISTRGTRLRHSNVGLTFQSLTRQVGITRRSASCRPRIHDLRHSFAVATVLDWYRDGVDVAAMMPRLSTFLGHTDPKDTYWYLQAAPELMALAGQRLDTHLAAHQATPGEGQR
jgi:integrase/recombinase XerD